MLQGKTGWGYQEKWPVSATGKGARGPRLPWQYLESGHGVSPNDAGAEGAETKWPGHALVLGTPTNV